MSPAATDTKPTLMLLDGNSLAFRAFYALPAENFKTQGGLTTNAVYGFTAMLMAGLDGIQNRLHPGDPMDKNLYDLPPQELVNVPTVCGSLREALISLQNDRAFLTKGDVFSDDQIDAYMELKWEEQMRWETTPSPVEYDLYYSS